MGAVPAPAGCFCSVSTHRQQPSGHAGGTTGPGGSCPWQEASAGPWQRGLEPGGAQRVGLEELTSFDCVADHWIEITLIGAF